MSAHYYGAKLEKSKRFQLGELLGTVCRHLLLMTATPHNGKEEDFQLFLSLLDGDRFYRKFREGAHKVDVSDMMRRMVKEDLLKFDGTPLFPERRAYTATEAGRVVSRRLQFVALRPDGQAHFAGWAPHLDLVPLEGADLARVEDLATAPWIGEGLEAAALRYASERLVPQHYDEVRIRRERQVDKTLAAVNDRLVKEINHWAGRYLKLKEDKEAGKQPAMQPENARRRYEELTVRLETRRKELAAQRHVVSAEKCGWDVTARPPAVDGKLPADRHIEVKGRAKGATTVTVSRNEVLYGLNQADKFILAIVPVDEAGHEGPFYVRRPFQSEPDFGVASINSSLEELLSRASQPGADICAGSGTGPAGFYTH